MKSQQRPPPVLLTLAGSQTERPDVRSGEMMKLFYTVILIIGIKMAFVMQFVDIAEPRDALVASRLSGSPDHWSLQMDESMRSLLSHYDVKAELVSALQKRAHFQNDIYKQNLLEGLALIALSIVGLVREKKIRKLKRIEPATAPYSEPATRSPQR